MTNSEAIEVIKAIYSNGNFLDECFNTVEFNDAMLLFTSALEENDKLKAEIDEWKKTVEYHRKKLLEFNNDNADLKAKIEQLKSELEQSVKLPCKIGDIVYTTNWLRSQVFKNITTGFQVYDGETFILTYEGLRISDKNMGSHLFLTREEAEQSLKGQVEE